MKRKYSKMFSASYVAKTLSTTFLSANMVIFLILSNIHISYAQEYTFKSVDIGGGGWVTGVIAHPTEQNLIYSRTDVGGAYRWNKQTQRWQQLIKASSMPI